MPKKLSSLSIFLPAYNEEKNIRLTIDAAKKAAALVTDTFEVIIVNDGSHDGTGAIAESMSKEDPRVRVVHHGRNQGYGAAVWSGIKASRYDYVFLSDADLQFNLNELKLLVEHIEDYPVVIGYRAKRRDPFIRLLNAKGWSLLIQLTFGLKVRDVDCAFKLFERRVLEDLTVQSRGAMLSAEILLQLQKKGVQFKQVPVTHLPRVAGNPTGASPKVIIRAFKELRQVYRTERKESTKKSA